MAAVIDLYSIVYSICGLFKARIFPPKLFKPAFPCNFPRLWVDGDDTSILYPDDLSLRVARPGSPSLYADLVSFFSSFFSKTSASIFFFPHRYPLVLAVNNHPPPAVFLSHALDGLEKIGGL